MQTCRSYDAPGDGKPWPLGTEVYGDRDLLPREVIPQKLTVPKAERVFFLRHALRAGFGVEEIYSTAIVRENMTAIGHSVQKRLIVIREAE